MLSFLRNNLENVKSAYNIVMVQKHSNELCYPNIRLIINIISKILHDRLMCITM